MIVVKYNEFERKAFSLPGEKMNDTINLFHSLISFIKREINPLAAKPSVENNFLMAHINGHRMLRWMVATQAWVRI